MRLTFNIADPVAKKFLVSVPSRKRSQVVSRLLGQALEKKQKNIIKACLKANNDKRLNKSIDEWQSFDTKIDGEWL